MGGTGSPNKSIFLPREKWIPLAPVVLFIPAVLFLAYKLNPPFSHNLAEMFSVIVACSVFMLTWNARKFIDNHYFIFLGIAYLFVGIIDYLHAVLFENVFSPNRHSPSIEIWFVARFLQSFALLSAPLFVSRKIRPGLVFTGFAAASTALVALAWTGIFPDYYHPGKGMAEAKRVSDHLVAVIQILSIGTFWWIRKHFDQDVFQLLVLSILFSIAAQLSANVYTDAYEYNSIFGHYLTVVSFYLLYKAIIVIGLNRPYDLLFRKMKRSEEEIRVARDELEARVTERTEELRVANVRLERELSGRIRMEEERGRTSHLLRESEDRFRSLVENDLVGTMIVQEGRIVFRNPELERLMGPIPEGFDFQRLGPPHPEDVPKFERFCDAVREGEPFRQGMELRFSVPERRDGAEDVPLGAMPDRSDRLPWKGRRSHQHGRHHAHERPRADRDGAGEARLPRPAGRRDRPRDPEPPLRDQYQHLHAGPALPAGGRDGPGREGEARRGRRPGEGRFRQDRCGRQTDHGLLQADPSPDGPGRRGPGRPRDPRPFGGQHPQAQTSSFMQELSPEPLYCRADATLLEQAILNLITNALQAMETVDREKFLRVGVAQEGQQAVIRVVDNGPGVPGDLLDKIFDPFYTTRKDGHGIGLSFSHRVISKHNGRLSAGAAEGGGAVFRIELPLWRDRRTA